MVFVTLAVVFGLTIVAGIFIGRTYRAEIKPFWDPAISAFEIVRFLMILLIAYGLWISGRVVLQLIAVIVIGLLGLYIAIEKPHRDITHD